MKLWSILFFLVAASSVAACGGTSSTLAPMPTSRQTPGTARTQAVTITVQVPARSTNARRRPAYISASTQSIAIAVNGATTTMNLTQSSPACQTLAAGLTCTTTVNAAVGSDTFAVTTYDQTGGAGNALSKASVTQNIIIDRANIVPLTLNGIVASIVVQFASPVPACTATAAPVTILAKDADNNTIVGNAPYDRTISLSYSDATNNSTLIGTTASKPGDGGSISYDGNYEPGGTVTATAAGVPTATGTFFPTPTVCAEYALPAQQSVEVLLRRYVTLGPDGNVYFPEQHIMSLGHVITTAGATLGTIVETPITSTAAAEGFTTTPVINDVATGPDGRLWMADAANGVDTLDPTTMLQSNYQSASARYGIEIAPGPDGRMWFIDTTHGTISAVTTAGVLSTPISLPHLTGQASGLVASNDKSAMWVSETGSYMIAKVPVNGSAITEYAVPNTSTDDTYAPNRLTSSHDGYLWFTEEQGGNVGRFNESDGTTQLFALPDAGARTYDIFLGADGNMWCTYEGNGQDYIARVTSTGVFTKYPILRAGNHGVFSITRGPSPANDMWFDETNNADERVGYLTI